MTTYPHIQEEVLEDKDGEKITGFLGQNKDRSWTVFFTYEGPDDRFIFGVLRNVSEEIAKAKYSAEKARHEAK